MPGALRRVVLAGGAAAVGLDLLVLAVLATAAALHAADADLYYRSVQEDEWLEWATFWSFLLAALIHLLAAAPSAGDAAAGGRGPRSLRAAWFPACVAVASALVALEEISWGQRLLGYRPPEYFLAHNYQQELNLHNVVATSARQLGVVVVLLGYGVALPVAGALPWVGERLRRIGVVPPPLGMAPAFAIACLAYDRYPWKHTGEWVELMMGLGFLLAGLAAWRPRSGARAVSGLAVSVLVLGVLAAALTRAASRDDPALQRAARAEIRALASDLVSRHMPLRCGLHKRLYTYARSYRAPLDRGEFRALVQRGLPAERADFFLDPWNSPYWLRVRCSGDGPRALVYSLGPNRRRDSTRSELSGDDLGTWVEPLRRR